jgi:DeoR/GlpR family transcriptional regulator of sugar metabolism
MRPAMNEVIKLSKKDRQDRILTELRVSTTIRISDLASELGVSYETIRRDLEEMGESGLINRTYGGAVVRPFGFEPAWNERFNAMTEERERIATTAAGLVQAREVLMIDAGSTTLHFARRLAAEAKNLTIVTNCFAVAMAFSNNPTITVLACPGQYDSHEGSVTGPDTINYLSRFNANRAVIGSSGITLEGPNDVHSSAAAVKRAMLARSQEHILLIDHSKFEMANLEVICPLTDIHRLVTDRAPPPELAGALSKARVELLF